MRKTICILILCIITLSMLVGCEVVSPQQNGPVLMPTSGPVPVTDNTSVPVTSEPVFVSPQQDGPVLIPNGK